MKSVKLVSSTQHTSPAMYRRRLADKEEETMKRWKTSIISTLLHVVPHTGNE